MTTLLHQFTFPALCQPQSLLHIAQDTKRMAVTCYTFDYLEYSKLQYYEKQAEMPASTCCIDSK